MGIQSNWPGLAGPTGLLLLLVACQLQAQEQALPQSEANDLVSLLEFIGEFTLKNGDWISPEQLENADGVLADTAESNAGGQVARPATTNSSEGQ